MFNLHFDLCFKSLTLFVSLVITDDLWTDYINCEDHTGGDGGGHAVCNRAATLYIVLACCFGVLAFLGSLLLIDPPEFYVPPEASTIIKDDNDIEDEIDSVISPLTPTPPPPLQGYEAPMNDHSGDDFTITTKGNSTEKYVAVTKRLLSSSGIGDVEVGSKTLSTDDYLSKLNRASNPQSIKELISLFTTKLCMLSFVFMGTPGVFIAGSYKAIGVQYFDNDRLKIAILKKMNLSLSPFFVVSLYFELFFVFLNILLNSFF